MKQSSLLFLVILCFLSGFTPLYAQHQSFHYTPPPEPMHFPQNYNYGDHSTVSLKHHFTVVFADGRDTTIYTTMVADSPAFYLPMVNKSVGKKDPARIIKILPSQTKYISHINPITGEEYVGQASDSCWLFKVIQGKMSAYTNYAEIYVEDEFIRYIQLGDGPMISVSSPEAEKLFGSNEKALELFIAKHYYKAVRKYNDLEKATSVQNK